jgi:hypothetical protein|tara:strand:- start:604 stop:762 length:159 start_codon:yes stop_codon:yes gene_type:complete
MVKKLTPKIMKIVAKHLDKEKVSSDDIHFILGNLYEIEDRIEKSKERNTLVN